MSLQPKVSIIIPSYNHKKYILQTINSIMEQTYKNIETIVLDDGSTDGSVEFLKDLQTKFKFQLVLKENEGICTTLNKGLDLASGEFIVIIASDDYMPKERITQQVDLLMKNNFDAIAGGVTLIDETSNELKYAGPPKLGRIEFKDMLNTNVIFAPTVMFKAQTFEKFGRYNPKNVIEDYPMWLKMLSNGGRIANFNRNWAYYRTDYIITRKKIDWHYKGVTQAFSEYLNDPMVMKAFMKIKFKYLMKVSIFDGKKGLNEVIDNESNGLSWWQLLIIHAVAVLPDSLRSNLKTRINKI